MAALYYCLASELSKAIFWHCARYCNLSWLTYLLPQSRVTAEDGCEGVLTYFLPSFDFLDALGFNAVHFLVSYVTYRMS